MSNDPTHPSRVLMTADTVGGVWTYAMELSRGLSAHGTQVILATMGAPLQPHQHAEIAALGEAVELHESNFRLEWMDDPWADVATAGEWLLHLERTRRPDIIHLNGYAHAALDFVAPKLVVAHSCVLSWWNAVKRSHVPPAWSHYRERVAEGLRGADLVVAPTRAMLKTLASLYGEFQDARVIYNGRDPAPARPSRSGEHSLIDPTLESGPARSDERGSLSLPAEKDAFVLSVGRLWDEAKNATVLASIARELTWPVRLAGDTRRPGGHDATPLPNVELIGRRSAAELAKDYERAAIYALPARYEPFGLSVLEAALAGCALVLGDIPTLRELWAGAASFVPPDDSNLLRAELTNLINHPYRRQVLGREAQHRAQRFSVARMTAGYLSAYASLLAKPRRHPTCTTSFA